jgi:hypothetical protein
VLANRNLFLSYLFFLIVITIKAGYQNLRALSLRFATFAVPVFGGDMREIVVHQLPAVIFFFGSRIRPGSKHVGLPYLYQHPGFSLSANGVIGLSTFSPYRQSSKLLPRHTCPGRSPTRQFIGIHLILEITDFSPSARH